MLKIIDLHTKPTPPYDLYIGRKNTWMGLEQSKWHNPFILKREKDRVKVLLEYYEYIIEQKQLLDCLEELDGKTLACWCHNDEPNHRLCHGDILRDLLKIKQMGVLDLLLTLPYRNSSSPVSYVRHYKYFKEIIQMELS